MEIEPAALIAERNQGRRTVILDVRSSAEFSAGHVPGAIHMPFWSVWLRARRLQVHRDDPVVVYCGHGPRAQIAAQALGFWGFRNVHLLKGHMAGWRRSGLPLE